jgi:TonB family protein
MAPLTRESVETSNPGNQSVMTQSPSPAKPASGRLRADAVSLEIHVKVHGSRVTEVARGVAPHTEPFEEQTNTMIVFPQGGVLKMSTLVSVGQMVVLTNLKSRQDAICRVQKVRVFSNMPGYVEVEFTHPQPGYWGVRFPSEGSPVANKQVTPAPTASAPPEPVHVAEKPVPEVSWAPAPPPAVTAEKTLDAQTSATEVRPVTPPPPAFTPPARPESSFISIGSQEKIQAVASNTPATGTTPHADQGMEPSPRESAKHTASIDVPPVQPAAPLPSLSMQELRGDEERARTSPSSEMPFADLKQDLGGVSVGATQSVATTHATFGTLSGGASLGPAPVASEADFGTRLGAGLAASAKDSEKPGRNWLLVAACVLGFVGVVGGPAYYYTRSFAGLRKPSPVQSVVANPTGVSYSTSSQPASNPSVTPQSAPMSGITVTERPAPVANTNRTDVATTRTGTSAKQPASRLTPNVVTATLNAHPIPSQRASAEDSNSAPSFDAGSVPASEQAAMPGVISSNSSILPKPEDAVRVGGDVKPGRLISSVQPLYPPTAKMSHIEGDVVIKTNIDEVGRPVNMHVISGPMALRQAAIDALRQWKYAPATLNGQPISTQLEVTIRFRL